MRTLVIFLVSFFFLSEVVSDGGFLGELFELNDEIRDTVSQELNIFNKLSHKDKKNLKHLMKKVKHLVKAAKSNDKVKEYFDLIKNLNDSQPVKKVKEIFTKIDIKDAKADDWKELIANIGSSLKMKAKKVIGEENGAQLSQTMKDKIKKAAILVNKQVEVAHPAIKSAIKSFFTPEEYDSYVKQIQDWTKGEEDDEEDDDDFEDMNILQTKDEAAMREWVKKRFTKPQHINNFLLPPKVLPKTTEKDDKENFFPKKEEKPWEEKVKENANKHSKKLRKNRKTLEDLLKGTDDEDQVIRDDSEMITLDGSQEKKVSTSVGKMDSKFDKLWFQHMKEQTKALAKKLFSKGSPGKRDKKEKKVLFAGNENWNEDDDDVYDDYEKDVPMVTSRQAAPWVKAKKNLEKRMLKFEKKMAKF